MSNLPHLPIEEHTHTPDELRRILAYRIRFAVTTGPTLSLRFADGKLDPTAIAAELALRDRKGLPHYIAELDGPEEARNPAPWRYCMDNGCSACMTAVSAHLLPLAPGKIDRSDADRFIAAWHAFSAALERPFRPWVYRAVNALARWIDDVTDALAARRAKK